MVVYESKRSYEEAFGEEEQFVESQQHHHHPHVLEMRKKKKKLERVVPISTGEEADDTLNPTSQEEPSTPTASSALHLVTYPPSLPSKPVDEDLELILETNENKIQKAQEQLVRFKHIWTSLPTSYLSGEKAAVAHFINGVGTDMRLQNKTTSLAILLFDRVRSSLSGLHRRDYIFFVLVCIELASKLEEEISCTYATLIHNYLDPTNLYYAPFTLEKMVQLESHVLNILDFNLNEVTVFDFLPFYLQFGFTSSNLPRQKIVENLKVVFLDSQEDSTPKLHVSNQNVDYVFKAQVEDLCDLLLKEAYPSNLQMNQDFTIYEIAAASIVSCRKYLGARVPLPRSLRLILQSPETVRNVQTCAALFDSFLGARRAQASNVNVLIS